jgi:biopolymer transport protein ExbD
MASLPDIIFMLLIFFMCATTLREEDPLVRTLLPEAEALTKIEQRRHVSYVRIGPLRQGAGGYGPTQIQVEDALVDDLTALRTILRRRLTEEPRLIVSLRVDRETEMGVVTDVQQELREAGTRRINYASRPEGPPR